MSRRAALRSATLAGLGFSLFASLAIAATAGAAARESRRLHRLLDQGWESKLRDRPEYATYIGYPGHNHRWTDLSAEGIERRRAQTRRQLAALRTIDRSRLVPEDQVDLDLYVRRLAGQIEGFSFREDELAITQYDGLQLYVPQVLAKAPVATGRDVDDLIARLNALPVLVDQTLALLAKGLEAGATPPKSLVRTGPYLVRALPPDDPWQSSLLAPFKRLGSSLDDEDVARFKSAALFAYERKAAPAFRKLLLYLVTTYLSAARESLGMGALPDGAAWYAYRLRQATTTDRSPAQIHEIGLSEVRRIRAEMDRVRVASGFTGTFAEYVRFLHTDPRFFYAQADDLTQGYRALGERVDAGLPSLFGAIPRLPLRIAAVPTDGAQSKSTIYYDIGSVARGTPGTCYVNTFDLRARPKWEMASLYLHECLPGHHLQVTIAQSIRKAPKVLNYHDYTPFVEGWGVYAETLGDDLGLYDDPQVKFGQLASELWRVMRVVVDSGIHAQGWTRQQAVEFFRETTAQDDRAIEIEIDRYLYEPALGVAYTVGELKFKELRAMAQQELGASFDLRAFHDEVLRHGALPLDLLEGNVRRWVRERKGAC